MAKKLYSYVCIFLKPDALANHNAQKLMPILLCTYIIMCFLVMSLCLHMTYSLISDTKIQQINSSGLNYTVACLDIRKI